MKGHPGNPGLKGRLVDKSVEAYVLALETINRLSIHYRVETFCYLICNAWELLLKAKILENIGDKEAIFEKRKKGQPRRSITLRDCLYRLFPDETDPVRRNIERMAELRDEATHLVFSGVPRDALCLFQAGVINYHKRLGDWFQVSLSDRVHVGMMSIVYDMGPQHSDMSDKRLRRELGKDAADFLSRFCSKVREEFEQLKCSVEFSIGVDYRLVLTDKPGSADIVLSKAITGSDPTHVVEVAKDPSKTHPLRQKEVLEQLESRVNGVGINSHDLQCVNKVHQIKARSEFFYQGKVKGSPGQYSPAFVDWLVSKFGTDSKFFQKARLAAKKNG
jgi:Protein of unknown function (DUF3644)/EC042_2821-lke REase